jgi:hypothetical protein
MARWARAGKSGGAEQICTLSDHEPGGYKVSQVAAGRRVADPICPHTQEAG